MVRAGGLVREGGGERGGVRGRGRESVSAEIRVSKMVSVRVGGLVREEVGRGGGWGMVS